MDNASKNNFVKDLTNREYNDQIKLLLFYCNILMEPTANANSVRCVYAYDFLKIAKDLLKEDFEWSILPVDIDNFKFKEIPIVTNVKKSTPKKHNFQDEEDYSKMVRRPANINTSIGLNIKSKR